MSEDLQKPPVVDLEALLTPISEENPSGESVRYSGLYDEISEARRADEVLNQGDWQTELKTADYRRVIDLAVPSLTSQTKDMQIAAWLSEALTRQHGFAGLRDSLKLLAGMQEAFWDTLHPEVDEGDMEGRANAIAWMDLQTSFAVKTAKITGGNSYSYLDWEDSKIFDIPDNIASFDSAEQQRLNELKTQAEKEGRTTADMWKAAQAATRRQFCEETNFAVEECWTAFNDLNKVIEEKFERNQMPGMGNLKKSLDAVHTLVKKLLEEKRLEEPDESDIAAEGEVAGEGGVAGVAGVATGAIQNRKDALKRLGDVADFFTKTEPHSPVAYLVQRAVKWGNMPLETWLRDVIKDEGVLGQIRQTLGFNTTTGDGDAASPPASSTTW